MPSQALIVFDSWLWKKSYPKIVRFFPTVSLIFSLCRNKYKINEWAVCVSLIIKNECRQRLLLKIFAEECLNHTLMPYTLQDIYSCVNTIVKAEVSQPFCVMGL